MKKFLLYLLSAALIVNPTQAFSLPPGAVILTSPTQVKEYRIIGQVGRSGEPGSYLYGVKKDGMLGAAVPSSPALIDTYLASGIDNVVTNMTLASGVTRAGTVLTGYTCFTIDVNTPVVEYVCGMASGTAITGLLRGVDLSNPNVTSSALAFPHRRFASVQISDYPTLQIITRKLNGVDPLNTPLVYDTSTANAISSGNPNQLASVGYVASTSFAGTSDASSFVKGIVQLATSSLLQISSSTGSTGAANVPTAGAFNQTSTPNRVPVANGLGVIDNNYINSTTLFNAFSTSTPFIPNKLAKTTASGTLDVRMIGTSTEPFGGAGSFLRSGTTGTYWGVMGINGASSTNRFLNTTYSVPSTSLARPRLVSVSLDTNWGTNQTGQCGIYKSNTTTPGVRVGRILAQVANSVTGHIEVPFSFLVPVGFTYRINDESSGGSCTVLSWYEEDL